MPPEELRRRAISRALANGGAAAVRRERYGLYFVRSATRFGIWHRVSVVGQNWFCTCEAALAGKPCWHQAATYIAKVESGGGRVTGPSVSPAPASPTEPASRRAWPVDTTPLRWVA
jgi:hypothetical protein